MYKKPTKQYRQYKELSGSLLEETKSVSQVVDIVNADHKKKILETSPICVVDLYAEWCAPCKKIAPAYSAFVDKYPDVFFCKEDVDKGITPGVGGVPTFQVYINGTLYTSFTGADLSKVEEIITSILSQ